VNSIANTFAKRSVEECVRDDHSGSSGSVALYSEAECEKRFLHRHKDLRIIGKQTDNSFCFIDAVDRKGEINAVHQLKTH
jgi:hypothetical protein